MPAKKSSLPSPTAADLQQAPDTLPDGPNVAPSAHEHEAAMGQPEPSPVDGSGNADGTGAGDGAGAADAREQRIREAAYALAQQRGFEPGRDMEDWLEAERLDGVGNVPASRA